MPRNQSSHSGKRERDRVPRFTPSPVLQVDTRKASKAILPAEPHQNAKSLCASFVEIIVPLLVSLSIVLSYRIIFTLARFRNHRATSISQCQINPSRTRRSRRSGLTMRLKVSRLPISKPTPQKRLSCQPQLALLSPNLRLYQTGNCRQPLALKVQF